MSNKNKVEILALIDRSGSMIGIIEEAVGAFNSFIKEQKELETDDKVKVTLASFDNKYELIYDRVPLEDVKPLTVDMVSPRGMTALYDSIAKIILAAKHPKRDTILLIQTDGYENASREFNNTAVKGLIKNKEAQGWDVNFLGAGIDAVAEGAKFGMDSSKSFTVDATHDGMAMMGATMSNITASYRSTKFDEFKADGQATDEGS